MHSAVHALDLRKEPERKRAPEFELEAVGGETLRLSDYAGKVVLIDFWATWCTPCKASVPWLNELQQKYGPRGFTVLGISMDQAGWGVVKPFITDMRIQYPVALGTKRVAYLYGDVENLPLSFLIDRDGRVAAIHEGPPNRKKFEKAIEALLGSEN